MGGPARDADGHLRALLEGIAADDKKRRREEEAIGLLKRAYTVDKEALGPDAAEVGQHLIGLGSAYHQQGKLEAASLTLEEARCKVVDEVGLPSVPGEAP